MLKNAKDAAATEALEIATYTAIERLAKALGDDETAQLAASIRADEERMLARVLREIPKLTRRRPRRSTGPAYDLTETGAGEAVADARRPGDQARRAPGPQGPGRRAGRGPGQGRRRVRGRPRDRPLRRSSPPTRSSRRLPELSQIDLAKIDVYERRDENRSTVLDRVATLRGDEPWPGYDELTAAEVRSRALRGRRRTRRAGPRLRARPQGPHDGPQRRRAPLTRA